MEGPSEFNIDGEIYHGLSCEAQIIPNAITFLGYEEAEVS